MRRWFLALVAMLVLMAREAPAQQSETRIALIIANESYVSPSLGRLPGTQRDAALMEQALRSAGFQVTVARNVNRTQMRDAIMGFARRLGQLGENGVGFFYYSGHGIADDPRGRNYLVPVDAQVSAVTDLPIVALSLNEQLDAIELAHARATVIVIDACRNTPISFGRGGRGLAPVSAVTDTLIAFSTQPGEIAADDGVYARVLSEELVRPGVRISQAFDTVQARVAEQTQRRQRPRYDNGLITPIVFVAAPVPPVQVATPVPQPAPAQATPSDPAASSTTTASTPDTRPNRRSTRQPNAREIAQLRQLALADTRRPDTDRSRDANRHPADVLEFAGVEPGMRVAEIGPGAGYFTRLLAVAVGDTGRVFAVDRPGTPERPRMIRAVEPLYTNITVLEQGYQSWRADEALDLILISQIYHDFHLPSLSIDVMAANRAMFEALKPGGRLVVIDHAAINGSDLSVAESLHRIDQYTVRRELEQAGFVFEEEANFLRNPADNRAARVFEADIRGQTDQFAMVFRRPR